jgi:uncharacterized radical SAM superfamily Fe-S cluster-containing enzyme
VYKKLRGRPLRDDKLRILDLLATSGVTTSLTVTLAGGVNEQELEPILEYFFSQRHVVSLGAAREKIVVVGGDKSLGTTRITGQLAEILAQVPEVVQALTGADLRKFLKDKLSPEDKQKKDK